MGRPLGLQHTYRGEAEPLFFRSGSAWGVLEAPDLRHRGSEGPNSCTRSRAKSPHLVEFPENVVQSSQKFPKRGIAECEDGVAK